MVDHSGSPNNFSFVQDTLDLPQCDVIMSNNTDVMPVEISPIFTLKKLSDSFQNEAIFSSKSEIENPSLNLELESIKSSLSPKIVSSKFEVN